MEFFVIFFVIVFCFSFVLLFGAPYLPSVKTQSNIALDLLEIKNGDVFYELGCGDGRVLLMAEQRGAKAIGYELNPIIFLFAKIRTFKKRQNITVIFGNFWSADLTNADKVYVFLLDKFMDRLDKKLESELKSGSLLASFAFKMHSKKHLKEKEAVFLYKY